LEAAAEVSATVLEDLTLGAIVRCCCCSCSGG